MSKAQKTITLHQFKGGSFSSSQEGVVVEAPVSLTVNGEVWMTFMCSPTELEALAVGFLYNEGLVDSLSEIASVRPCTSGENVDIWLHKAVENPKTWRRTSGCTGGVTSTDAASPVKPAFHANGRRYSPRQVAQLVANLFENQEVYRKVGGIHTSLLCEGEQALVSAEDIGRHNTLDKIAGLCLLNKVPTHGRCLVTTGRVSSEMMQKAIRMEVSMVISRTSPTALSIELAEGAGITLIGYARRDRFTVYAHPERILTDTTKPGSQKFHLNNEHTNGTNPNS
jgi:FdhD protein